MGMRLVLRIMYVWCVTTCTCCTTSSSAMAVSLAPGQVRWKRCNQYALICNGCTSALQTRACQISRLERVRHAINMHRAIRLPMLVLSFLTSEVLGRHLLSASMSNPFRRNHAPVTYACVFPAIMLYDVQIANERRDTCVYCERILLTVSVTYVFPYRRPGRHWQVSAITQC